MQYNSVNTQAVSSAINGICCECEIIGEGKDVFLLKLGFSFGLKILIYDTQEWHPLATHFSKFYLSTDNVGVTDNFTKQFSPWCKSFGDSLIKAGGCKIEGCKSVTCYGVYSKEMAVGWKKSKVQLSGCQQISMGKSRREGTA